MNKTKIEYLDYTWNPIKMKCTPVSAGCINCWHLQRAKMLASNPNIPQKHRDAYSGDPPVLDPKELEAPLHKKPARIGVQFMGDILHDSIPNMTIDLIWEIMGKCPQHTFFFLTKRIHRLLKDYDTESGLLKNLWLGVSVENQKTKPRIDILREIPATKRFISFEPLLEDVGEINFEGISWAIVGGETGHKARPLHPDWVRSVKDQCQAAGVPFFFKSWGEWAPLGPTKAKQMVRVGHKHSGCLLDGQEWKEMPCTD